MFFFLFLSRETRASKRKSVDKNEFFVQQMSGPIVEVSKCCFIILELVLQYSYLIRSREFYLFGSTPHRLSDYNKTYKCHTF